MLLSIPQCIIPEFPDTISQWQHIKILTECFWQFLWKKTSLWWECPIWSTWSKQAWTFLSQNRYKTCCHTHLPIYIGLRVDWPISPYLAKCTDTPRGGYKWISVKSNTKLLNTIYTEISANKKFSHVLVFFTWISYFYFWFFGFKSS